MVLALQLLPFKQVIQFFFIDNQLSEEIVHSPSGLAKKFQLLDEDHKVLPPLQYLLPQFIVVDNSHSFQLSEMLPDFHTADIQTPPPNYV